MERARVGGRRYSIAPALNAAFMPMRSDAGARVIEIVVHNSGVCSAVNTGLAYRSYTPLPFLVFTFFRRISFPYCRNGSCTLLLNSPCLFGFSDTAPTIRCHPERGEGSAFRKAQAKSHIHPTSLFLA
jgi:hypothetical protein